MKPAQIFHQYIWIIKNPEIVLAIPGFLIVEEKVY